MTLGSAVGQVVAQIKRHRTSLSRIGVLLTGTAFAQFISVAVTPVLTRLYSPEQFGVLAVFGAILSAVTVPATLRYENAIYLPASPRLAAHVTILACIVAGAMSVLAFISVAFGRQAIATLTSTPEMALFAWLLPIGVLGAGVNAALSNWTIRQRDFRPIAKITVTRAVAQAGVQVGSGLAGIGSIGLILGRMIATIGGIVPLATLAARRNRAAFRRIRIRTLVLLARRYEAFPRLATGSAVLETVKEQLPVLMIASFYGPYIAGIIALTSRLLMMPMTFLGRAVGQAYLASLPNHVRNGSGAYRLYLKTTAGLLCVGLMLIAVVIVGGDLLVRILGDEWEGVNEFVGILGVLYLAQFVSRPVTRTLDVLERQGIKITGELIQLGIVITTLGTGALLQWPATQTVFFYSVAASISCVVMLEITRRILYRLPSS